MITRLDELLTPRSSGRSIVVAGAADSEMIETVKAVEFEYKLASTLLLGERDKIKEIADQHETPIKDEQIIDLKGDVEMAARAIAMVRAGEADIPMKGLIQTSTFFKAVLDKEKGLRGSRLLSEITIYEKVWGGPGLQMLTCCALNVSPDLNAKKQIIENAVELALNLGIELPKVACVAAVEMVNPDMPDTIDGAVLSKMAQRGQIKNCLVDGPLGFDNAVSPAEAKHKGLTGEVPGHADILLMSDIRMGNVCHKTLTYLGQKQVATAICGATRPVVSTSRSDTPYAKLVSAALALYLLG